MSNKTIAQIGRRSRFARLGSAVGGAAIGRGGGGLLAPPSIYCSLRAPGGYGRTAAAVGAHTHSHAAILNLVAPADDHTQYARAGASRVGTISIEANSSIDQDLTTDSATAQFATVTLSNEGLHLLDTDASHDLILKPGSNLTADRILTITTGDAARTFSLLGNLTVEAASLINQDLTTDSATAQFGTLTLTTGLLTPQIGPAADTDLLGLAPGQFDVAGFIYARGAPGAALQGEQIRFGRSDSVVRPHSIHSNHSNVDASNWLEFRIHDKGGTPYQGQTAILRLDITSTTINNNLIVGGTLTVNGNQTGATDHVFDEYDDIALLHTWRDGGKLPFATGDMLNRDRLLRDTILQLAARIETLEARYATH